VRVSSAGARGVIMWRQDGRELYYITPEWEGMAIDVATTPAFKAGTPRLLFKLPAPVIGNPQQWRNVSADGRRFVFTVNVPEPATPRGEGPGSPSAGSGPRRWNWTRRCSARDETLRMSNRQHRTGR